MRNSCEQMASELLCCVVLIVLIALPGVLSVRVLCHAYCSSSSCIVDMYSTLAVAAVIAIPSPDLLSLSVAAALCYACSAATCRSNMPPADVSVLSRQLIVAGPQHLARHTIEEAAEAAERCAARTGQSYIAARVLDKQQRDSHFEAQMELDGHFVQVGVWAVLHIDHRPVCGSTHLITHTQMSGGVLTQQLRTQKCSCQ